MWRTRLQLANVREFGRCPWWPSGQHGDEAACRTGGFSRAELAKHARICLTRCSLHFAVQRFTGCCVRQVLRHMLPAALYYVVRRCVRHTLVIARFVKQRHYMHREHLSYTLLANVCDARHHRMLYKTRAASCAYRAYDIQCGICMHHVMGNMCYVERRHQSKREDTL